MKKLGKLSINPEKLIQIDELKVLKGGQCSFCICNCFDPLIVWQDFYCFTEDIIQDIEDHCGEYGSGFCNC